MIKKLVLFLFVGLLCMGGLTSCERIDAGNEGILVNLYGDDRGVDQVSMCTGWVWYNPVTQQVYEYPTFVQQIDYPAFKMNAKDGSEFTLDPTVSLKIKTDKSPYVFKCITNTKIFYGFFTESRLHCIYTFNYYRNSYLCTN